MLSPSTPQLVQMLPTLQVYQPQISLSWSLSCLTLLAGPVIMWDCLPLCKMNVLMPTSSLFPYKGSKAEVRTSNEK